MLQRSSTKLAHYNRGAQRQATFASVLQCCHTAAVPPSVADFSACDAGGARLLLRTGSINTTTRVVGSLHSQPRPCSICNWSSYHSERGPIARRRRAARGSCGDLFSIRHGGGGVSSRGCGGNIGDSARSSRRSTVGANSGRRSNSTAALKENVDGDGASVLQRPLRGGSSTAADGGNGDLMRSFLLTDIGEGIMEVEILQWFVSPGDRVRQFDKLCEVQSDKANVEITSRYDGIVRKIYHAVGEMAQTGCVLMDIEEVSAAAGAPYSFPALSSAEQPAPTVLSPTPSRRLDEDVGGDAEEGNGLARKRVLATPAVRKLCRDLGLDIAPITGSGPAGRVLKGDVFAYASARGIPLPPPYRKGSTNLDADTHGSGGGEGVWNEVAKQSLNTHTPVPERNVRVMDEGLGAARVAEQQQDGAGLRERSRTSVAVPIKGVQRAMMEVMRKSLEVPHMTFCDEMAADRLSQLRADLKEEAERRGVKLSYMPLLVKATSLALSVYPALNASLSECSSQLLQHADHNIGVAMDTEKGLLVPSISCVQDRSILDIAKELNTLQRLGAAGKLGERELTGTTFTLSNIGSIGGTYASPIILHPQVCIGALGRMQRVPRFDSQDPHKVIGVNVIPVSWSADHRVIDGGTLARFSNLWKAYLENPARMLADTC